MNGKQLVIVFIIFLSSIAHAETFIKMGRWFNEYDDSYGQKVKGMSQKVVEEERTKTPPDQLAEFDRMAAQLAKNNDKNYYSCMKSKSHIVTIKDFMTKMTRSLERGPPWLCIFSEQNLDASGFSFKQDCKTKANAHSESVFKVSFTDTSYLVDINTRSPVVTGDDGRAVGGVISSHGAVKGRWLSSQCQPGDEVDDFDSPDNQEDEVQ